MKSIDNIGKQHYCLLDCFFNNTRGMDVPFNKFEKEEKVIELHKQGKTLRQIAAIVHKNFRDISNIIKKYERQKELNAKREISNQNCQIKQPSITSQTYNLFRDGKKLTDVAIELEIPAKKAVRLWSQFLKLERMYECYEFYKDYSYDIPTLISIITFMKRNNVYGPDIVNVLREAKDVNNLKQTYLHIKNEIEKLRQIKNNLQYSQNNYLPPLKPLPKPINWDF